MSGTFDGIEIRVWMLRNGHRPTDIARELGVSISAVTHWLNGDNASRRLTSHLLSLGCPREILGAPDEMEEAA